MVILSAANVAKEFGSETLFSGVSFHMEELDRVGLVGVNGAGKSTLFRLITGEMEPDAGQIHVNRSTIGYMQQYICHDRGQTMLEQALSGFADLMQAERELERLSAQIDRSGGDAALIERQLRLQDEFHARGGLTFRSRVRAALLGLGFSPDDLDRPLSQLSGGEKSKVSLAQLLTCDAKLMLLDEPTNHLDIRSVEWLENFLQEYNGAYIVISHDRYFLDRVTNRILELDQGRLSMYAGGYSDYLAQKEKNREIERHHYENQMKEIRRIEGIIEQQRRWNREKNIKTAESKEKMLERMKEQLVLPERENDAVRFHFQALPGGGNDVLTVGGLKKSFDGRTLFQNAEMLIKNGERVFLLGENGCGKTTLLRILMGELAQDSGFVRLGTGIKCGYYDQNLSGLHDEKTVLNEVWDAYPRLTQTEVRGALAVFLFTGDDVLKTVSALSGGERARVALLKLMLSKANFLLFDEPTNHLDISSREALESALREYEGTLLIVSHDRYFINKLADRVLVLSPDGVTGYLGGYDDYVRRIEAIEAERQSEKENAPKKKKVNEYQQKKELESTRRKTAGKRNRLEQAIGETEEELERIKTRLSEPETGTDYETILQLTESLRETQDKLDEMYEEWEALETLLAKLGEE